MARKTIDCRTSPKRRQLHAALSGKPGKLITAATQGLSSRSWPTAACEGAKP